MDERVIPVKKGWPTLIGMALIGYARVSTLDQTPALQLDALSEAGCTKIFDDHASGARADRPGLQRALGYVREGDVLVVWKLDRLGRSLAHLIEVVTALEQRGVGFRSITRRSTPRRPAVLSHFEISTAAPRFR